MGDILKPRIAFIGAGRVSEFHIKAAEANGYSLDSICGRDGSVNAKTLARKYKFKNYCHSVDDVNVDNIDAISIIVDPKNLINIYKKFESKKIAILVEKPVAIESGKLNLVDLHRSSTMVAFNRRFYSSVISFKESISLLNYFQGHVNFSELSWKTRSTTKEKNEMIITNGIHIFDLLLHLFGEPNIIHSSSIKDSKNLYGASFVIEFSSKKIITMNINFGVPRNHSLELYSGSEVFELKPIEIFTKTIGMKHSILPGKSFKSYFPVNSKAWKINRNDINYKPGFFQMYKTFKEITIGNDTKCFPTLTDAKSALSFAEKINDILRGNSL